MKLGEYYIIQKENPYHEWDVREYIEKKNLKITRDKWDEKSLRKYRYSGIMDTKEVLWLSIGKMTTGIRKALEEIKLRRRLVIIEVSTGEERKWLQSIKIDGETARPLPSIRTWQEKEQECLKILGRFRVEFDYAETQKRLIGLMIRDPESWKDIKLGAEIVKRTGEKITIPFLQDMFPSMDFYRVDDWIKSLLEGKLKGKNIKIAHYFIHEKNYSVVWLMQRIRTRVKELSLVYDAYRSGIVLGEVTKARILERSSVVGWTGGDKLAEMKPAELRWCLRVIEDIPYKYFVSVQNLLFTGDDIISKEEELYRYIEEIKHKRGEYDNGVSKQ